MPRFDQDFIEKVREANNIVDIIGQYTDLKGRGDQHMGLCPFPDHNEKTPSFSVSESKQLYHCFGCKKSGNLFTFLETYNGLPFTEAVEFLARRAHIEIPKTTVDPHYERKKEDQNILMRINKLGAFFYYQKLKALPDNHKVKTYLRDRGLPEELWEEFKLGYAPEGWDELTKYFTSKKVPLKNAEQLGILRRNRNNGLFDLFRSRIMFPIFSLNQEVVGFGGRIVDEGQPKYINSVESPVFKKGKIFYGLHRSAAAIRQQDQALVVEGYMDYLSLYANDVKNVVATLGTALTADHVRLLKRWTKNIILFFDGDQAGQEGAERSLKAFFQSGFSPRVIQLDEGSDPDDYIRSHGLDEFKQLVEKAEDLFLVLLRKWMQGYRGSPSEKLAIVDRLKPLLNELTEPRLKQIYIDEVAQRISEDPQRVYGWLSAGKQANRPNPQPQEPDKPKQLQRLKLDRASKNELLTLGLSLKSQGLLELFENDGGVQYLASEEIREIFGLILAKYRQDPGSFDKLRHLVVSQIANPEKIVDLINFSSPFNEGDGDERMMRECLRQAKDRYLQREAARLTHEVKDQATPEKLERIMNIQKERIALKKQKESTQGE